MTKISYYGNNVRPYHIALAHHIANTQPHEQERMGKANARFQRLAYTEQMLCRIEIAEVKAAKRGERVATIA